MKFNKLYFYRLLINAGLFLLPLGIWYLCEQLNYGPLLKIVPKITWLAIIMAVPVLIQVLGFLISLYDDRFRPFVYGSVIPILYRTGQILYRLMMNCYYNMMQHAPYAKDSVKLKWAKFQKMTAVLMKFDFVTFLAACACLIICRLIVVFMWKKVGKKPLIAKEWRIEDDSHTDSIIHGSAEICSQKYLRQMNREDGMPIGGIVESKYYSNPYHPKFLEDVRTKKTKEILRLHPTHTVVVAPTGQGKGVGIVIPTLLDYQGSVVVTDIKGENYAVVANQRRKMGKKGLSRIFCKTMQRSNIP